MHKDTRVFLIRHGEVHDAGLFNGQRDVSLTGRGVYQFTRLSDTLPRLDAVISSDLRRCFDGARIIASRQGVSPVILPGLREMSFGNWEGMSAKEIESRYPDEWRSFMNDSFSFRPDGGETYNEVAGRVLSCYGAVLDDFRGKQIAVVTHGGVTRVILNDILKTAQRIFSLEQRFCGVNIIDYHKDCATVKLINGTAAGLSAGVSV